MCDIGVCCNFLGFLGQCWDIPEAKAHVGISPRPRPMLGYPRGQGPCWDFSEALVSKTRRGFSLNVRRGGTVLFLGLEVYHEEKGPKVLFRG